SAIADPTVQVTQNLPGKEADGSAEHDSTSVDSLQSDTLTTKAVRDSIAFQTDSLRTDSLRIDSLARNSDIQTTVTYMAQDSTIKDIDGKMVHLYGNAEVSYGLINLKAHYIRLNWVDNEIYAEGRYDSTSKKMEGEPIFQDGT